MLKPNLSLGNFQQATADLYQVNPILGLLRLGGIGFLFMSLVIFAWSIENLLVFLTITAIAGIFYAFWLVCTHDAVHRTLTGWQWFDSVVPRLISYPMLGFYGLYAELHRFHHGWNGIDLRDPERVQWTWEEYQNSNALMQWYVRHQWAIDVFVLGGVGLTLKTVITALRFQSLVPRIRRQALIDGFGMILFHSIVLTLAFNQGIVGKYLLFWLVLERVIGMIMQTRDHLEHYGLWGKASSFQITQLYACRNLKTNTLVNWLMGGLPYHAVHHLLPGIPFNHLPEAFQQIQAILQQNELPPMQQGKGYVQETWRLAGHPCVIGAAAPEADRQRNQMISVKL